MARAVKWGGKHRRVTGRQAAEIAAPVYACVNCRHQTERKPAQCRRCGHLAFEFFHSTGEASRWAALLLKEQAGIVADLKKQVPFQLLAYIAQNGRAGIVGKYIADFVYIRDGKIIIEDFKGGITDLASWKLRHLAQQHPEYIIKTTSQGDL